MLWFRLSVGYIGGFAEGREKAWKFLKHCALDLKNDPDMALLRIEGEILRLFPNESGASVEEFCETAKYYLENARDFGIVEEGKFISLKASGSGDEGSIRELVCRAICRLIIYDMHKMNIDINMEVL